MKRLWSLSSLVLSVFSLSACSVDIPNIEFCRDKGKLGAVCAFWQNAKETKKNVSFAEWNQRRFGMVCTSEAGMGNINRIIEELCQSAECETQVQDLIKAIK